MECVRYLKLKAVQPDVFFVADFYLARQYIIHVNDGFYI